MKKWTYHRAHSYIGLDGNKVSMLSQQYQIGTYMILNDNPALQANTTPAAMVRTEAKLRKLEAAGEIKDLVLSVQITVTEVDGFYKEVEDANTK